MRLTETIERIAEKIAPGRSPLFTEVHVIKTIEIIQAQEFIGRGKLSNMLGLGEGTTRTLVRHLKRNGLIKISRTGIRLSEDGVKLYSILRDKMSKEIEIPPSSLTLGPFNVAILVKNAGSSVKSGLEQRDLAIMTGAYGATTLVYTRNKLMMPGVTKDIFEKIPSIHATLMSELNPQENDVIIVGSAESRNLAEIGAKIAAFQLIRDITPK